MTTQLQDQDSVAPDGILARPAAQTESAFYRGNAWCLNAYPTVSEAISHLRNELEKPQDALERWQRTEVLTNIFLLSCGVVSTVEDYLQGPSYRLPRRMAAIPCSRIFLKLLQKTADFWHRRRCCAVRAWQQVWDDACADFMALFVQEDPDSDGFVEAARRLAALLPPLFPAGLLAQRLKVPSGFRRHDLTHHDVLTLGQRFAAAFPDKEQQILVVGPRTAGSYLAPVLHAFLKNAGYQTASLITVRPKQDPTAEEWTRLTRCASHGYRAVMVDDPPGTGGTVVAAVRMLRGAGFAADHIVALLPIHPTARDWRSHSSALELADITAVSLPQEEWYKSVQLDPARVEPLLQCCFQQQGYRRARIVPSRRADRISAQFRRAVETTRGTRLKRVYEIQIEDEQGRTETRLVLAKSVGWGWLGYHAFTAGDRLAGFTPPILGLREGILYSEWLDKDETAVAGGDDRERWIDAAADYTAERVRRLTLNGDPVPQLVRQQDSRGMELVASVLAGACSSGLARALRRGRLRARLAALYNPFPTLIDGRMRPEEWVRADGAFLKTDYEHHGLGKYEINVADPAYDLADFIYGLDLSAAEEARLLARYIAGSGDQAVEERLYLNKLLAGLFSRIDALSGLATPFQVERQEEFHRQFVRSWNFLTVQTLRHCGRYCRKPATPSWLSPLAVLDIDGVLDRRLFGFPSTTAAGVQALSLLHGHGFALAMNSARSALEVREYCQGYGLAGGVGEYGSYLWDAVAGRERVLVTAESAEQLERLRTALARLPGVFLNDTYRHSIRANVYEDGGPIPIPTLMVKRLLADLKLDRLRFHQTSIDTTVTAAEVDKGKGLTALLHWVGLENADTTAVGDSEPDLPMFRAARRCFAPAQITCRQEARMLGCHIVGQPYQAGLLAIARMLVHPDGRRCERCAACSPGWPRGDLFFDLLETADQGKWRLLLRALIDPKAFQIFVK